MKIKRKIIEIDEEKCNGCGQCAIACAEGAIEIRDGKAKVISDNLCDGLGACIGECPEDALKIIEREADDFDEEAVEKHLAEKTKEEKKPLPCGCPSARLQQFVPPTPCETANQPVSAVNEVSAISNWPIQIRLIPPTAPFLKGADLLVTADCAPVALPTFQRDFLKGRVVMMGCPKFDDMESYIEKFTKIFKVADIKSIVCPIMEVPCCSSLPVVLLQAMKNAGKEIPLERVVISCRGEVNEREKLV